MLKRKHGRAHNNGSPQTVVGRLLQAFLLHEDKLFDELAVKLNRGRDGWNDYEPAVAQAAFETAIRRYFGESYDVRAVVRFAGDFSEASRGDVDVTQAEAEALIRHALGDVEADISGINDGRKLLISTPMLGLVCGWMKLDEEDIVRLVMSAERAAFERGLRPPPAAG